MSRPIEATGSALPKKAGVVTVSAAVQVVAGVAAMPSPALDVALIAWRVRHLAALYGVHPGRRPFPEVIPRS